MRKDIAFMKGQNLMDYSLLIVVEKKIKLKKYKEENREQNDLDTGGSSRYSLQFDED